MMTITDYYKWLSINKLKILLIISIGFYSLQNSQAQVKIGINPEQIQKSSILELESVTKGLLLPRLPDTLAINALKPVDGMLIYLEKLPQSGLYVRKNGVWNFLSGVSGVSNNIDASKLNLQNIGGKIDPATQLSAAPTAVSGQVLSWNGSVWEPKTILQVSTAIVEKAKEFNLTSVGNLVIEPNSTNVVKIPVSGAVPGDIVFVALIGDTPDFSVYNSWVSGTNEVSIRFANYQSNSVTITGTQYKVLLMK